ncbi:MAG: helix-turn-helix domain-containing protein [Nitrososphaerales archaeon]
MEQYLTINDLARITHWEKQVIYRKAASGEIPGRVKMGRSVRFKRSEIEYWLRDAERAGKIGWASSSAKDK